MSDKKVCLHLACGTVYLLSNEQEEWINIDIKQSGTLRARDYPELVETNGTDMDHYYKVNVVKEDFMKGKFHEKPAIVDAYADIRCLDYPLDSIDKIVAIQVVEHLTNYEAMATLQTWYDILKVGGTLQVHVPDVQGIIDEYNDSIPSGDIDWAIRQLYGSHKNPYNVHKSGYTRTSLKRLLHKVGFNKISILDNIHTYPSVCLLATK